jgi:hypothetical protein
MRQSKKGITLVELIICCAIIVMLGGACSAVLASGSKIFNKSSSTATSQLDADVLQNHMMNLLPSTKSVGQITVDDAKDLTSGNCLFFDAENENLFTIRIDGKNTTIRSVEEFAYDLVRAGDPDSQTARAQLVYTVTLANGKTFSGGFVLSNLKYDEATMSTIIGNVSEKPFFFSKNS